MHGKTVSSLSTAVPEVARGQAENSHLLVRQSIFPISLIAFTPASRPSGDRINKID
ncbi:hypothetical protein OPIT5_28520 [Opitutaceae bacterium TAV5]|nr:hypothetical protein OPIT5_28520 [Opitutaceae bacterium TAV5]